MQTEFTLADLTKLTGAKRRSVQLWAEAGVIVADADTERAGTGVHRKFTRDEAIVANVIAAIAKLQVSIGKLKEISLRLRQAVIDPDPRFKDVIRSAAINDDPVYVLVSLDDHGPLKFGVYAPVHSLSLAEDHNSDVQTFLAESPFATNQREYLYAWGLGKFIRDFDEQGRRGVSVTIHLNNHLRALR